MFYRRPSGCTSVRPLSVDTFRVTRYFFNSGRISLKLATNIHHLRWHWALLKRFSMLKVKGQGH